MEPLTTHNRFYYCDHCGKHVISHLVPTIRKEEINGVQIQYPAYELTCPLCGYEMSFLDFHLYNQRSRMDAYKRKKGLLTSHELGKIQERSGLSEKELSITLRLGPTYFHRMIWGTLPPKYVETLMERVYQNPQAVDYLKAHPDEHAKTRWRVNYPVIRRLLKELDENGY